ncbi:HEAT repeat domain-containing protein, partial [Pantoea agglomerans]
TLQPLDAVAQPTGNLKKLFMNNRLRVLVNNALAAHQLVSSDTALRLRAAQQLQSEGVADQLPLLEQRFAAEQDSRVHAALALALANLQLADGEPMVRLRAVKLLGESSDPNTQASLQRLTQPANEPDATVRAAAAESLQQIQKRLMWGDLLGQAFSGLSLGSILLLAALGLAITYG